MNDNHVRALLLRFTPVLPVAGRGAARVWNVWMGLAIALVVMVLLQPAPLSAHDVTPQTSTELLEHLGFDQRLNEQVPLETAFRNEAGEAVQLATYFGEQPVILALGYFECPNLCSLVRTGLLEALQVLQFDAGVQYEVVLISIDPAETPEVAARVKEQTLQVYGRSGAESGWHFLTGEHDAIDQVADAVGFRYAYDSVQEQFGHASGIVVLTPAGKVARYFFGLEYAPRDLRLGLVEAASHRIGSAIDQILLFCYHYNPITGQYTLAVMTIMRIAGIATMLLIGGAIWWMLRQERSPRAG